MDGVEAELLPRLVVWRQDLDHQGGRGKEGPGRAAAMQGSVRDPEVVRGFQG